MSSLWVWLPLLSSLKNVRLISSKLDGWKLAVNYDRQNNHGEYGFYHDEGSVGYNSCSKSPNLPHTSFIPRLHAVIRGNGALAKQPWWHPRPQSYRDTHGHLPAPILKAHVLIFLTFKSDFLKIQFLNNSTF